MKIMQIHNSLCWWDATSTVHTIDEAREMFPPDCIFVEAPDYVFEGWGYDEHADGDARFIRPEAPDGYLYDEDTGTFYPADAPSEAEQLAETVEAMRAMLAEAEARLAALNGGE